MAKRGLTIEAFKAKALGVIVFQKNAEDAVGYAQDDEWRVALYRARTWARVAEVLPWKHPLATMAAIIDADFEGEGR